GVRKPYPTKDGHLAFVPYSDAHWHRLFTLVGRPELIDDPRFSTFAARMKHPVEAFGFLEETLRGRTTAEWVALLEKEDMPMAAVNAIEDLIHEPHLESVGFWKMFDHPSEGMLRMARNPLGLSDSPAAIRRLPPRLGEHTREVLHEFEFDAAEIDRLIAAGVARQGPQLGATIA
ncbi:MAG: hypothetical protein JWQ73_4349, partial [Variovorax sp.]|nr:hypothetical protein [Variovorax sp.]